MFLEDNIEVFRNSEDSEILIGKLSFYWNYLSPQLLTHLVKTLSRKEEALLTVRKYIDGYETKLKEFKVKTPLDLFSQVDNEYKKPQKYFCEVVVHFINDVSKKTTMQDVERFRMR